MVRDVDRLFELALRWSTHLRTLSGRVPRPAVVTAALASLEATSQLIEYIRESPAEDLCYVASVDVSPLFWLSNGVHLRNPAGISYELCFSGLCC